MPGGRPTDGDPGPPGGGGRPGPSWPASWWRWPCRVSTTRPTSCVSEHRWRPGPSASWPLRRPGAPAPATRPRRSSGARHRLPSRPSAPRSRRRASSCPRGCYGPSVLPGASLPPRGRRELPDYLAEPAPTAAEPSTTATEPSAAVPERIVPEPGRGSERPAPDLWSSDTAADALASLKRASPTSDSDCPSDSNGDSAPAHGNSATTAPATAERQSTASLPARVRSAPASASAPVPAPPPAPGRTVRLRALGRRRRPPPPSQRLRSPPPAPSARPAERATPPRRSPRSRPSLCRSGSIR